MSRRGLKLIIVSISLMIAKLTQAQGIWFTEPSTSDLICIDETVFEIPAPQAVEYDSLLDDDTNTDTDVDANAKDIDPSLIMLHLPASHDGAQVVSSGCHFGNTDTCSDIEWFHRAIGFVWVGLLSTE